jgi:hypothetical protein
MKKQKFLNYLFIVMLGMKMSQPDKETKLSDAAKRALELDQKFAEHIKKLNETESVSYIDEEGYVVMRSPDGVITRMRNVPSVKS